MPFAGKPRVYSSDNIETKGPHNQLNPEEDHVAIILYNSRTGEISADRHEMCSTVLAWGFPRVVGKYMMSSRPQVGVCTLSDKTRQCLWYHLPTFEIHVTNPVFDSIEVYTIIEGSSLRSKTLVLCPIHIADAVGIKGAIASLSLGRDLVPSTEVSWPAQHLVLLKLAMDTWTSCKCIIPPAADVSALLTLAFCPTDTNSYKTRQLFRSETTRLALIDAAFDANKIFKDEAIHLQRSIQGVVSKLSEFVTEEKLRGLGVLEPLQLVVGDIESLILSISNDQESLAIKRASVSLSLNNPIMLPNYTDA